MTDAAPIVERWLHDLGFRRDGLPMWTITRGQLENLVEVALKSVEPTPAAQGAEKKCTCGNNFANPEPFCAVHYPNAAQGAGPQPPDRLWELARQQARTQHIDAAEVNEFLTSRGIHVFANGTDHGFDACPHPDCVLVRGLGPAPTEEK